MKKSTLIAAAASSLLLLAGSCSGKKEPRIHRAPAIDLTAAEFVPGDTLYSSDSLVVTTCYVISGDNSETATLILRSRPATSVTDTTMIDGFFNGISVNWPSLDIVNGIDTASYAVDSLPALISPIDSMRLPGTLRIDVCHSFSISDDDPPCDFDAIIYVRRHPKAEVSEFLNHRMQQSFDLMFDSGAVEPVTPEMDVKQAAEFLAKQFEKAYKKEYADEKIKPVYTFDAFYYPDWQSEDGSLVTYMLYNEQYYGGAHGMMTGQYVTFDTRSGRPLGIDDIFTPKGFARAEELLTRMVRKYTGDPSMNAWLSEADENSNPALVYEGKVYPRPALTPHGVAFAYQPYAIAPFSEGVRYFLIPYSALGKRSLRR